MIENPERSEQCLNCGAKVTGKYCPNCGQEHADYNISVKHFVHDFLGDYFTFDSKFFRSFIPLIIKPGFLTNEYISGRRVRYIPPVRMYIFISVIFFFLLSVSKNKSDIIKISHNEKETAVVQDSISANDSTLIQNRKTNEIGSDSSSIQKDKNDTESWLVKFLKKADKNKEETRSNFLSTLSKMMFLLLPIFALLLKIIYIRSKNLYVHHLIFSIHFHSFFFLMSIVSVLVSSAFKVIKFDQATNFAFLISLIYLFMAMKSVYKQSTFKTIIKLMMMSFSYLLVFGVSFAIVGIIAIMMI